MANVTHADKEGNYFIAKNTAKNTIVVYLHLGTEKNTRELGVVNTETKVFRIKRNPEKHLFKKNQSYGFNEYVIKTAQKFDTIHLIEEKGNQFLFPKNLVLEKGSYLHFKNEGFEKQLFVKLTDLMPYKINPSM
jgi:hypothetical protein